MDNHERVANGVAWLDENGPDDWRNLIDLTTLDISDSGFCVLGQVYAPEADKAGVRDGYLYSQTFFKERPGLGVTSDEFTAWADWLSENGFLAHYGDGDITELWLKEIA